MSYLLPLLSHIAFKNAPKKLDVAEEAVRTLSISINPSIYPSIYLSMYIYISYKCNDIRTSL